MNGKYVVKIIYFNDNDYLESMNYYFFKDKEIANKFFDWVIKLNNKLSYKFELHFYFKAIDDSIEYYDQYFSYENEISG